VQDHELTWGADGMGGEIQGLGLAEHAMPGRQGGREGEAAEMVKVEFGNGEKAILTLNLVVLASLTLEACIVVIYVWTVDCLFFWFVWT
jgi:hypothetical protein